MMVPVVSLVGKSGSGKTTLIEKVIAELTRRGWRVGSVKHDAHGFEMDREGKDSWRHKKAGSRTVVLSSKEKFAVIKDTDQEWDLAHLIEAFQTDADVVVTEGFKTAGFPKIEVVRSENSRNLVCAGDPNLIGVVTDVEGLGGDMPRFGLDDYSAVTDFIVERIIKPFRTTALSLVVDGHVVKLNPFAESVIRHGILGMVSSLKGGSADADVEIRIRRPKAGKES